MPHSEFGNTLFGIIFFEAWLAAVGSYIYFGLRARSATLRRWADEAGYQDFECKPLNPFDKAWSFSDNLTQDVSLCRVVVCDEAGLELTGLVRVRHSGWFRMPVSVLDVRWDPPPPAPWAAPQRDHPLWDRDVD